jgi:hypothetical protein
VRQIHFSAWLLVLLSAILQIIIFPLPGIYVRSCGRVRRATSRLPVP